MGCGNVAYTSMTWKEKLAGRKKRGLPITRIAPRAPPQLHWANTSILRYGMNSKRKHRKLKTTRNMLEGHEIHAAPKLTTYLQHNINW